jgi:glutamyl-Q tRNA(Asp) synthetase
VAAYRGRFAPSPTGLLHRGSLLAALASWLDARAHGGQWLVRMEDLDSARNIPGADAAMVDTLAQFGLVSDETVIRQSSRTTAYLAALEQLRDSGLVYRCDCSRSDEPGVYSGRCRKRGVTTPGSAWRMRMPDVLPSFADRLQGHCVYSAEEIGDPVIFRRDGVCAYQLAVVIDDDWQGITDVVRGADLLQSTVWQRAIAEALHMTPPRHAHVPLLLEADGSKLAKSRQSVPLAGMAPQATLFATLQLLDHSPPATMENAGMEDLLTWAVTHWQPQRLSGKAAIRLPAAIRLA